MKSEEIIVSVCMITYNHEKFIREAIEGVLMQKTTFPIELIIGEDCSTDLTRKIVEEYAEKYPKLIRILLPEENLGMSENFIETMQAARGKYIALCEGDDYWTDPYKLQKQVDFLDNNKKYDLCSHKFDILDNEFKEEHISRFSPIISDDLNGVEFSFKDNLKEWHSQTLTLVFRSDVFNQFDLSGFKNFCDFHLCYLMTMKKFAYCMNFVGAVYRLNDGGVFSKQSLERKTYLGYYTTKDLYNNINDGLAKDIYIENRKAFFENFLRLSLLKKHYSFVLFRELFCYLIEDVKEKGFVFFTFSIKKLILSVLKSVTYKNK